MVFLFHINWTNSVGGKGLTSKSSVSVRETSSSFSSLLSQHDQKVLAKKGLCDKVETGSKFGKVKEYDKPNLPSCS